MSIPDPLAIEAYVRSFRHEQEIAKQGMQLSQLERDIQQRCQRIQADLEKKLKQNEEEGGDTVALKQVIEQVQLLQTQQDEQLSFEHFCKQKLEMLQTHIGKADPQELSTLKMQVNAIEARLAENPVAALQREIQASVDSLQQECVEQKKASELIVKMNAKMRAQLQVVIQEAEQQQRYYEDIRQQLGSQCEIQAKHHAEQQAGLYRQFIALKESLEQRVSKVEGRVDGHAVRLTHIEANHPGRTVHQKIIKLRQAVLEDQFIQKELQYYIEPNGQMTLGGAPTPLYPWVKETFLDSEAKVLLLLGEAGTGKSTFNRFLLQDLWRHPSWERFTSGDAPPQAYLPILIPLGSQAVEPSNLFAYLTRLPELIEDFTTAELEILKRDYRLLLIADGFDEIPGQQALNLYDVNQLAKYAGRIKLLVSCRNQRIQGLDVHSCFAPHAADGNVQLSAYTQRQVAAFNQAQTHAYLEKYVAQQSGAVTDSPDTVRWPTAAAYEAQFKQLPGLTALLQTPFLLRMTIEALPGIVQALTETTGAASTPAGEQKDSAASKLTLAKLYDYFMESWFKREAEKARLKGESTPPKELMRDYRQFCKKFAECLSRAHVTQVQYPYRGTGDLFAEADEADIDPTGPRGPWVQELLGGPEETKKAIVRARQGAPLLIATGNYYGFIHASLMDYFFTTAIAQEAARPADVRAAGAETPPLAGLSNRSADVLLAESLLSRDQWLLLADRVRKEDAFKDYLLGLIETSKRTPAQAIAAANAASVLNAAEISLSNLDWRGVRLPGADLSGALLDATQLQGADLTQVNLQGAWLRGADLGGATLTGIRLGAWPSIQMKEQINCCAYSPDGRWMAVTQGDDIVIVDTSTRQVVKRLQGHTSTVRSVAWDASGQRLASGSMDKSVRVWEVASGTELRCLQGHSDNVTSVAWEASGQRLASGSDDTSVRVWEVASGTELRCLQGHTWSVTSVAWDASGQRLASGSWDKSVRVWEVASGTELRCLQGHTGYVYSVAWEASGQRLASGSWDSSVRVWEVASGTELRCLQGHTDWVISVAWDASGQRLASGSKDKSVRVWEVASGTELRCLQGHTDWVISVAWDASGQRLASGSKDKSVRVWEVASGTELRCLQGHSDNVTSVAWEASGQRLASGSDDTSVRVWEVASGTELRCLQGHTGYVYSVAWEASGQRLASGSWDSSVRVWEVASGTELRCLQGHTNTVNSVAWDSSGQRLASGSEDKSVRVWEVASGTELCCLQGHTKTVRSIAWEASGQRLASGSEDGSVRVWEVASGAELRCLQARMSYVYSVAWEASGQRLASGSLDASVRVWEVASGTELRCLQGHTSYVYSVAWDASGQRLASGSHDKSARVWEVASGRELLRLDLPWKVYQCAWTKTSQGVELLAVAFGNAVACYELEPATPRYTARLRWLKLDGARLNAHSLNLADTTGLSADNLTLLQQHGAHGEPARLQAQAAAEEKISYSRAPHPAGEAATPARLAAQQGFLASPPRAAPALEIPAAEEQETTKKWEVKSTQNLRK